MLILTVVSELARSGGREVVARVVAGSGVSIARAAGAGGAGLAGDARVAGAVGEAATVAEAARAWNEHIREARYKRNSERAALAGRGERALRRGTQQGLVAPPVRMRMACSLTSLREGVALVGGGGDFGGHGKRKRGRGEE